MGCVLLRLTPPWSINHDCGWYLYLAARTLAGDQLYVDVLEVNPPLILYLSLLPASLAAACSIALTTAFALCVMGLVGLSCWLTDRVLRGLPSLAGRRWELLAGLLVVLVVLVGEDFGQREHLLSICLVPWLAMVVVRLRADAEPGALVSTGVALAVGGLAGLGIALKPWFLLVPLLVRVGLGRRLGPWFGKPRAEHTGLVAVLGVYLLHFTLVPWTADFLAVAERLAQTYHGMDAAWDSVLLGPWSRLWASLAVMLLFAGAAWAPLRPALLTLGLASLALFGAAIWQRKGWSYHFQPALATAHLGVLVVLVARLGATPGRALRGLWFAGLLALVAVSVGEHWLRRLPFDRGLAWELPFTGIPEGLEQLESLHAGQSVLLLDTDMPPLFAWLGDHGIRSAGRYAHLWTLPVALAEPPRWRRLVAEIAADIRRHRPAQIYLRRGVLTFCPPGSPEFAAQLYREPEIRQLLEGYQRLAVAGRFDVWAPRR